MNIPDENKRERSGGIFQQLLDWVWHQPKPIVRPEEGPSGIPFGSTKRLSTKGKVHERDPARIRRKKRRQQARLSRQVNRAVARG